MCLFILIYVLTNKKLFLYITCEVRIFLDINLIRFLSVFLDLDLKIRPIMTDFSNVVSLNILVPFFFVFQVKKGNKSVCHCFFNFRQFVNGSK